jgi:hypothetical protein
MACCGILKKLKAAFKAIYQRVVFKYACVYNKSIAWQRYYFLPREINKRKSNKLIFEGESVEASLAAFKASSLTWSQWADVAATPDVVNNDNTNKHAYTSRHGSTDALLCRSLRTIINRCIDQQGVTGRGWWSTK